MHARQFIPPDVAALQPPFRAEAFKVHTDATAAVDTGERGDEGSYNPIHRKGRDAT